MNHEDIVCFKCSKFNPTTTDVRRGGDVWIHRVCPVSTCMCTVCKDYEPVESTHSEPILRSCKRWDELILDNQESVCRYLLDNEYSLSMSMWDAAEAIKEDELSFGHALDVYNEYVRHIYVEYVDFEIKNIRLGAL